MGGVEHAAEESGHFLSLRVQCDWYTVVAHLDVLGKRLVLGRKDNTVVFQSRPLLGAVTLGSVLPPTVLLLVVLFLLLWTFLLCGLLALLSRSSRSSALRLCCCTLGGSLLQWLVVVRRSLLLDTVGLLLWCNLLLEWNVALISVLGLHSSLVGLCANCLGLCFCFLLDDGLLLGKLLGERNVGVVFFANLLCGDLRRLASSLLSKRLVVFRVRRRLVLGCPSALGLQSELEQEDRDDVDATHQWNIVFVLRFGRVLVTLAIH